MSPWDIGIMKTILPLESIEEKSIDREKWYDSRHVIKRSSAANPIYWRTLLTSREFCDTIGHKRYNPMRKKLLRELCKQVIEKDIGIRIWSPLNTKKRNRRRAWTKHMITPSFTRAFSLWFHRCSLPSLWWVHDWWCTKGKGKVNRCHQSLVYVSFSEI